MDEKTKEKMITSAMLLTMQTLIERLELVASQLEKLVNKNTEAFKLAGEDFTRRIIQAEVDKHIKANNTGSRLQSTKPEHPLCSGTAQRQQRSLNDNTKKISFNITSGSQEDN